ncbi:phosphodiester glycosidase family protein [Antrihabitans cavernicola]|uniref:Phosphodiester glycosidase family protein n=1 Tax=Antrihabitans cavernicola TaxID=2495913 RepID=A0A5A7SB28_9NOCA|nr:phosphodiester glycosidase family protein [Spelaeibacter cavernicola]KAA0022362.1 phosphodiester glycosidase family protein [Spelaeibacter cavernicola]
MCSYSYASAVFAPGYATWTDKTATWLRDHGGAPLVDAYENWRYARPPRTIAPDLKRALDSTGLMGHAKRAWVRGRTGSDGTVHSFTTLYQPDPQHRATVIGVAVIPMIGVVAHLMAGTTQPQTSTTTLARVPDSDFANLVATFNSGFKMNDTAGGFYSDRTLGRALVDGQASAVIDDTGHLTVEQWGRDVVMNPHIVAVRQNLALIVDHGAPVSGLSRNRDSSWGNAKNQLQYTERSALGTKANGDLIYIAGANVNLTTLAQSLADAGAVRGMELDIHSGLTAFSSWTVGGDGKLSPTSLLPGVQKRPDRYLNEDRRDFFYVTLAPRRAR